MYSKTNQSSDRWFISDDQFNQLFPAHFHSQINMHWTPLAIAKKAVEFLTLQKSNKVLDIGSGAGKFCLAAAFYRPDCFFTGVEQRKELVEAAESARVKLQLTNVQFIHSNIINIDFSAYRHFYFFNSFFENIDEGFRIDDAVSYSGDLFRAYSAYVLRQLETRPSGTRLVSFHSVEDEIPHSFHEIASADDQLLKCWVKE
ncbi:MAG: hypothetical protein RLZZ28_776 [Bacteroidota bacterium]|jgi:SAM-dependent methyltransferase